MDGGRVEVARSFSFKLNIGNYQSCDFFCSQKMECDAADAASIGEQIYRFCKESVMRNVREYLAETKNVEGQLRSR